MRKTTLYCLLIALAAVLSCAKKAAGDREDIIYVYDSPDGTLPIEKTWVSVQGGTVTYYIHSVQSFDVKWQDSGDGWASVGSPVNLGDGRWKVELTARPLSHRTLAKGECLYQKRYGVLLFTSPSRFVGTYLKVEQGMDLRRYDDFSVISGSSEPNATYADLRIDRWSAAQKGLGYTSTPLPGQDTIAWVFGKDGYVKLGSDDGIGANFIHPGVSGLQNDTLAVLCFSAVVQNGDNLPDFQGGTEPYTPMRSIRTRSSAGGNAEEDKDAGFLTVRIEGGGFIRDFIDRSGTSIRFDDLPTYDRQSAEYPADIFKGARYLVFLEGTDKNPLSVNTKIIFEAGDMSGEKMAKPDRVFLDDVCLFRVSDLWDEDIFKLAKKSGRDSVL